MTGGGAGRRRRRVLLQRQLEREWSAVLELPSSVFRGRAEVAALVERGVPPGLRQRVWPLLLGNGLKITPESFEL